MKSVKIIFSILIFFISCKKASAPDPLKSAITSNPSALSATRTGLTQVTLNWTSIANNLTGFTVERQINNSGNYSVIATLNKDSRSYVDSDLGSLTLYSYRINSFNLAGPSSVYSNVVEIILEPLPIVYTDETIQFGSNSALSGGRFGAGTVLSKGVVWSTTPNPTIALSTKTQDGQDATNYKSYATNLSANTTYYFRAYATNSVGTSYGGQVVLNILSNISTVAGGGIGHPPYPETKKVFVDDLGNIYAGQGGSISKWTPGNPNAVRVAGDSSTGTDLGKLNEPNGIWIDNAGNLYVSDFWNSRVQKWLTNGSIQTVAGCLNSSTKLPDNGISTNCLTFPSDIQVDMVGNIYISDKSNHRVQKWAPGATNGITVAGAPNDFGFGGTASNKLNYPEGIYVDNGGVVYVADSRNHRIQKWSPGATSGITVAGGNGAGAANNQLNEPKDVYVDSAGNIYIADTNNHRVQKWVPGASTGITVAGGNGLGRAANQLNFPEGIFMTSNSILYIADTKNGRIQRIVL